MKPDNVSHSKFEVVTRAKQQKAKETPPLCCWHCNKTFPQLKEFQRHLGGFQLEFVSISPITPSIPEIIWVKNVRAIVVCGFLIKSLKNHIMKI